MSSDTAVVMPARNEEGTVAALVREVATLGYCVIVVDDASTDATGDRAFEAGARVLRMADNLGAWGATQCGMRLALRLGIRRVVTFDADGQHRADSIPALISEHDRTGADVVVGSCVARGNRSRLLAWRIFKAVTGLQVHDLTSGLRVYGKRALELLITPAGSLIDYQDIGVLLMLREAGCTVVEHPVTMASRSSGQSRIFRNWFAVSEYMLFTFILAVCGNHRIGRGLRP